MEEITHMTPQHVRRADAERLEELRKERKRQLGALIRQHRAEMTQEDLGVQLARFQFDGRPIPQTTISRWEQGKVDLTMEQVWDIEEALRLPHGELSLEVGYVERAIAERARGEVDVLDAIRRDPRIDKGLRPAATNAVQAFIEASERTKLLTTSRTPARSPR
jgi:transcriptional regulator with XRE-family HTH domain